jgi:hypothetical protein
MGELSSSTSETGSSMTELSGTTDQFNSSISETGGFVQETGTSMNELGTATTETGTAVTDTGTAMTDFGTATTETNTALTESTDALGNMVPSLEDTAKGAEDTASGFETMQPALEDTNTALDSSSGLLEGVSPLLSDTGTNAGTAAGGTEDFSGALGGLNTELGPATGGLGDANKLVGDYWPEADKSAKSTDDLKGSMSTLALGLTTVVGAGYGLVNSFLGIRDAQLRLDRSNIAVDKSMSSVDKQILAMSKSLRKLATDSEAPITGLANMNRAFSDFVRLVQSGVTSGPKYTEALNNLKLAADGLHGSTVKDNQAIDAFQISVGTLATKIGTADLKIRQQQKSNENLTKSYIDAGMGIATFVGGMGSMVQTLTSGAAAAGVMKGAFVDLSIILSQSVIPALGAIAVPVGIAVAAIVGFIAAVEAIRMNIKVFDDLGVKIGEVFPEMKGFLEDARQGFINMSDGINTAIGHLLAGIDSVSGGTTNLAQQWGDWTDTLPKGTGEIGDAGKALGQMDHIMHATGEQINIGKGKWEDLNGTLVAFGGKVKVAAGGWHEMRDGTAVYSKSALEATAVTEDVTTAVDAMGPSFGAVGYIVKQQSANFSELTNAQKLNKESLNSVIEGLADEKKNRYDALKAAENYLVAHGTTAKAVGLSGDVLIGYVNSLKNEGPAYSASVQKASEYISTKHKEIDLRGKTDEWILKTAASLEEEDKALGKVTDTTAKHVQEMDKLQTTLNEATAELTFYSDSTNIANRLQLEFSNGVANAGLKLIDQKAALANNSGELEGNLALLEEGKLQEVEYGEGVLKSNQALVEKTRALSESKGEYEETNRLMKEAGLLALDEAIGRQEALSATQKQTEELHKQIGALTAWEDATNRANEQQNAALKGWLEAKNRTREASLAYFEAAGRIRGLNEEFGNAQAKLDRLNTAILTGAGDAIEWYQEIETAGAEANAFHQVLVSLASKLSDLPGIMEMSTEQLQRFIGVAMGAPDAIQNVVDGIDGMARTIVDRLGKAGEEGKVDFMENMEDLEKELGTKFSKPTEIALVAAFNMDDATKKAQLAASTMAAIIAGSLTDIPGPGVVWDTPKIQAGARDMMTVVEEQMARSPEIAARLQPLQDSLNTLATTDLNTMPIGQAGQVLAGLLTNSENLEGQLPGLIGALSQIPSVSQAGTEGFTALDTAIAGTGFSVNSLGQVVNDTTGEIVGKIGDMATQSEDPLIQLANSIGGVGDAGGKARLIMAQELVALSKVIEGFTTGTMERMGRITTSFGSMANNTGTHMLTMSKQIVALSTVIQGFVTGVQTRLGTITTAFGSMVKNTSSHLSSFTSNFKGAMSSIVSDANRAIAGVNALQRAIDSLKSKTITLTTIHESVYTTRYAAKGGAFIASSPTNVGPLNVSEFGQKELVTVTPLEGPGRNAIKGVSSAINDEITKKGRRRMDDQEEQKTERKSSKPTILHDTINVTLEGRTLLNFIQRRLLENTDALT